jgi:hypothetical protein
VLATTVDLVPLRADLEPARRDGWLRALGGLAMFVVDEAETPATVNGDSARLGGTTDASAWRTSRRCTPKRQASARTLRPSRSCALRICSYRLTFDLLGMTR